MTIIKNRMETITKQPTSHWHNYNTTTMIETTIGKTITTVNDNKSKQRHKAVKDTDLRYACDYCSLRDLECSIIKCGRDERTDSNDIHYELENHY